MHRPQRQLGLVALTLALTAPLGCGPTATSTPDGAVASTESPLTEGAALSVYDASCLRLQDANTWSTYASNLQGVGTLRGLTGVLGDLNRSGPVLTATTHPPVAGYRGGFRWNDGDMAVTYWIPQGLAAGTSGSTNVALVSWHYDETVGGTPDRGVRLSVADISNMGGTAVPYRHVLLVRPSTAGSYVSVNVHAGGMAWVGNYLYVADTSNGMRVFDLTQIREVDDSAACADSIGKVGTTWCANGYKYILPQMSAYTVPSTITSPCKPKFSFLGKDSRGSDVLLSGEYCNTSSATCAMDGATPGLGGRLYRWPIDAATGRLQAVSGSVSPVRAYFMNEMYVQGVAPILSRNTDGSYKYPADAYWLNASRYNGSLFKVSTGASRTLYRASLGEWLWIPEGMHATSSGTNLWSVNEGYNGSTDPASGGRVVIYVDQASVD